MMTLNVLDWIIMAALILFVIQAIVSGFFQEAFNIAGLVFGYLIAAWQYRPLALWFERFFKAAWFAEIAAFLLIFFAVMIVAGILGSLARWLMKKSGLSAVDRLLGGVVGVLRGGLTVALVLVAVAAFTPTSQWLQGSQLAPYFLVVGRAATWLAPADLRARFYQGLALVKHEADAAKSAANARSSK
jgi:membrane protein required for colicin V production